MSWRRLVRQRSWDGLKCPLRKEVPLSQKGMKGNEPAEEAEVHWVCQVLARLPAELDMQFVFWACISVPLLRMGGTSSSSFPRGHGIAKGVAAACHLAQFQWVATAGHQQSLSHAWVALAEAQELRRDMGKQTSPSSDNGTETGQGLQGCQTKMVLIAIMHLYSNSKF